MTCEFIGRSPVDVTWPQGGEGWEPTLTRQTTIEDAPVAVGKKRCVFGLFFFTQLDDWTLPDAGTTTLELRIVTAAHGTEAFTHLFPAGGGKYLNTWIPSPVEYDLAAGDSIQFWYQFNMTHTDEWGTFTNQVYMEWGYTAVEYNA